jgi:hypothetical protein
MADAFTQLETYVKQLQSVFPQLTAEKARDILLEKNLNFENALQSCLAISNQNSNKESKTVDPKVVDDFDPFTIKPSATSPTKTSKDSENNVLDLLGMDFGTSATQQAPPTAKAPQSVAKKPEERSEPVKPKKEPQIETKPRKLSVSKATAKKYSAEHEKAATTIQRCFKKCKFHIYRRKISTTTRNANPQNS